MTCMKSSCSLSSITLAGLKAPSLNQYARSIDPSRLQEAQKFNEAIAAIKQWFVDNPGIADRYLDELS